ncbi:MAG: winged helix DNA-binding protein [Sphingomonas sp.]|uniref:winged helix DNA-binding protein n=1 Tax=Sphingomonas sp. TaxID=28214 RepID=UPI001AFF2D5E|nr:winged helix DNA-binding protein [Sphingomonas sp.]MBO9622088.1 winged helix DNA-binding protein [Sphingomonas sp.]
MAQAGMMAGGDGYALRPNLLVIADDPARAQLAEEAAECAGLRVTARTDVEGAAEAIERIAMLDAVAIETAGVAEARLEALLGQIHDFAEGGRVGVVAVAEPHQLDQVAGALLGPGRQILCEPGAAERTLAMLLAGRAPEARLSDVTRDAERARLQRLHEEVARIADTLARMTRGEEAPRTSGPVRTPGIDYRGPETDEVRVTAAELRAVLRARRMRAQFFDGELFADPAWDMLLDLFAADIERRRVSVSSLCIAAAVPPTTALRWIGTLHDAGLFERQPDPADRRRAYIALSAKGLEGMHGLTGALKRAGLHLV